MAETAVTTTERAQQIPASALKIGAKLKGYATENKRLADENAALKATNATLAAKAADLEKQVLTPDAKDKKIAELTSTIRTGKHKARFDELAKAAGADGSALDDLYTLSGHKAESDEPDDVALQAVIDGLKQSKRYAFEKAGGGDTGTPPAKEIPGRGRGAAHTGGDATIVTAENRIDPAFMLDPRRQGAIHAAAKEGRFR